ncbi:MAG: hypothetical protein ACE5MK_12445 [Acidobacteriota bacterium]
MDPNVCTGKACIRGLRFPSFSLAWSFGLRRDQGSGT